ncbi:olfactory receptor 10A7-like [Hyperolius riggenbachi]|uniref:olfactory receptor 10A7-like n=1 Tax=Hyperolius riggenbachi TaxID=752182 RepID=UPI0035A2B4C1
MHTNFTDFLLLGFSDVSPSLQVVLFILFLLAYILTMVGNGLIMLTVSLEPVLNTPMYFFLRNLSCHEICSITITVPKVLENFLSKDKSISFFSCGFQNFIFFANGVSECIFLAIMALDRYLAICNPLRYSSIMTKQLCYQLTVSSLVIGSTVSLLDNSMIFSLPFCGSNHIAHFFCDDPPVLSLACANTFLYELSVFISCLCGALLPFLLILCSYIKILISILAMHSSEGRQKALSTCSSHLVSVILFYGTAMSMYLRLGTSRSDKNDRMISLFYCLVIPVINPLVYSLRNKEIKVALRKLISKVTHKIIFCQPFFIFYMHCGTTFFCASHSLM